MSFQLIPCIESPIAIFIAAFVGSNSIMTQKMYLWRKSIRLINNYFCIYFFCTICKCKMKSTYKTYFLYNSMPWQSDRVTYVDEVVSGHKTTYKATLKNLQNISLITFKDESLGKCLQQPFIGQSQRFPPCGEGSHCSESIWIPNSSKALSATSSETTLIEIRYFNN